MRARTTAPGKLLSRPGGAALTIMAANLVMLTLVACNGGHAAPGTLASETPTPGTPVPPPTRTPNPGKPPPPPDWANRWLQGIPCRAPCWEGITPGQTTASEAVTILSGSPLVGNVQKETRAFAPDLGDVFWSWVDGQDGGEANYPAKDAAEVIYRIAPSFRVSYRLGDVIQSYGEPSHIVAIAEHSPDSRDIFFGIWVIYLPQGLVIRGDGRQKPELDGNTRFNQVVFSIPTRAAIENTVYAAKDHPEWVIPWQGFKGFDFYCRDTAGGKWCRGETN